MPPLWLCQRGEHPVSDDDNDDGNVKPARTTSGGADFCPRRLDGGLGEAKLPPVEEPSLLGDDSSRDSLLSRPPCKVQLAAPSPSHPPQAASLLAASSSRASQLAEEEAAALAAGDGKPARASSKAAALQGGGASCDGAA